jgi:phenolic acid decarboxylase
MLMDKANKINTTQKHGFMTVPKWLADSHIMIISHCYKNKVFHSNKNQDKVDMSEAVSVTDSFYCVQMFTKSLGL